MKSSLHSLIHFLPSFSITFDCHLQNSTKLSPTTLSDDFLCPFITPGHEPRRKHRLSIVEKACLLIRCLALDVLLLRAYVSAEMCLPSRCLAMGLNVTILILLQSGQDIFSYSQASDRIYSLPNLVFNGYWDFFPRG
jgi:hypothetical protein